MRLDAAFTRMPPPTRRQWQTWTSREPALRGLSYEQLRAELDTDWCASTGRADELLAGLWRVARQDVDAGRVLLACLLPGARSTAAGYRRCLGYDEALAIAVEAMWDRIARFDPFDREVAFRLKWLARRRVHEATIKMREHGDRCRPLTDQVKLPAAPSGLPVLVLLGEAADAAVVSRRGVWLVWATRCAGMSLVEAAELAEVAYDTAQKSRRRAELRLRCWLEEAA